MEPEFSNSTPRFRALDKPVPLGLRRAIAAPGAATAQEQRLSELSHGLASAGS